MLPVRFGDIARCVGSLSRAIVDPSRIGGDEPSEVKDMSKRIGLAIAALVVGLAALGAPREAAAAAASTPAMFSGGKIDCVSPGRQLRIRTPTVGTLFPADRLRPTYVEARAFYRTSNDGSNWSSWALATSYARTTASFYAAASWGDTVLTLQISRPTAVQVAYIAWWWNGYSWIRGDLWADEYTTYSGVSWAHLSSFCALAP